MLLLSLFNSWMFTVMLVLNWNPRPLISQIVNISTIDIHYLLKIHISKIHKLSAETLHKAL
jgi:hypothetical protein